MALGNPASRIATPTRIGTNKSRARRRQTLVAYAFLAPSLIVFLFFRHGPAAFSFLLAFFDWTMVDSPQWVGLDNFRTLIHDDVFWKALKNTLWYTLYSVPPDIVIAMLLAVLINQKLRGMRLFRLAYFVPVVTATAIVAVVWQWLYQPTGIINGIFRISGWSHASGSPMPAPCFRRWRSWRSGSMSDSTCSSSWPVCNRFRPSWKKQPGWTEPGGRAFSSTSLCR
jgi:ABC-type sugar transport system permease subunit